MAAVKICDFLRYPMMNDWVGATAIGFLAQGPFSTIPKRRRAIGLGQRALVRPGNGTLSGKKCSQSAKKYPVPLTLKLLKRTKELPSFSRTLKTPSVTRQEPKDTAERTKVSL